MCGCWQFIAVERYSQDQNEPKESASLDIGYYATSLDIKEQDDAAIVALIRGHWSAIETALITGAMSPWERTQTVPLIEKAPLCWPASATWLTASTNCRKIERKPPPTHSTPGASNKLSPPFGRSSIGNPLANQKITLGVRRTDPSRHTPSDGPHTTLESAGRRTGYPIQRHADSHGLIQSPPISRLRQPIPKTR